MRKLLAMTVVVLAACTSGSGPGKTVDPYVGAKAAVINLLNVQKDGQFGKAWDELHPAQQAKLTKDTYLACMQRHNAGVPAGTTFTVEQAYHVTVDVPDTALVDQDGVAVKVVANTGTTKRSQTTNEFLVDGQYRWVLSNNQILDCNNNS